MKMSNANHQMTDVWNLSAIEGWEKIHGKHPTQKPINLFS